VKTALESKYGLSLRIYVYTPKIRIYTVYPTHYGTYARNTRSYGVSALQLRRPANPTYERSAPPRRGPSQGPSRLCGWSAWRDGRCVCVNGGEGGGPVDAAACADGAHGATERWATACAWRARCMKSGNGVAGVAAFLPWRCGWWSEQQATWMR
jgi:hypothetical protein